MIYHLADQSCKYLGEQSSYMKADKGQVTLKLDRADIFDLALLHQTQRYKFKEGCKNCRITSIWHYE